MFKANYFVARVLIHAMHHALHKKHDHETDPQDMRNMGALREKMPITYWSMLLSTMAIAGVPAFSQVFIERCNISRDFSFAQNHPVHFLLPVFGFLAAAITAFYMFRMMFLTFHGEAKKPELMSDIP